MIIWLLYLPDRVNVKTEDTSETKRLYVEEIKGMALNKEEKALLKEKKLTYHMMILCLVTCEELINKNAYLSKKWGNYLKNSVEGNSYEYYKQEWMDYREKIRSVLKEKYQMRNVIRDVKECKDKASQEDVKRIVTLIDDGEYVLVSDSRQ